MAVPMLLSLEFDSYKIKLFQDSSKIQSEVFAHSSHSALFKSEVYGMTQKDFIDLATKPSNWLEKCLKVDIKTQNISFCRGLRGGGAGAIKSQAKFNLTQTKVIEDCVNRISKTMAKGYINFEDLKILEDADLYEISSLADIFCKLFDSFFDKIFFVSPILVKEREKISRIMRLCLHISLHPSFNKYSLKRLTNGNSLRILKNKIQEISDRDSLFEQRTIIDLQVIQDLLDSGTDMWKDINDNKKFPELGKSIFESSDKNVKQYLQTIKNYSTNNLKTIKDKDLASFLQYLLKKKWLKPKFNEIIISQLLILVESGSETQICIILNFLAICFEEGELKADNVITLLNRFKSHNETPRNKLKPQVTLSILSFLSVLNESQDATIKENLILFYQEFRPQIQNLSDMIEFSKVSKKLSSELPSTTLDSSQIINDLLKNEKFRGFIGRTEELKKIDETFFINTGNKDRYSSVPTNINSVILHGSPGIGKTALAYKFMGNSQLKFKTMFFFDCSTDESLEADIFQCLLNMGLPLENGQRAIAQFKGYLETCKDSILIVLDNLSIFETLLSKLYFFRSNIFYLVTSRVINECDDRRFRFIEVKDLTEQDAIRILKLHLNDFKNSQPINNLALNLKSSPAYIKLAASLVSESFSSVDELCSIGFDSNNLDNILTRYTQNKEIQLVLSVLICIKPIRIPKNIIRGLFSSEETWNETRIELIKKRLVYEFEEIWEFDEQIISRFRIPKNDDSLTKVTKELVKIQPDYLIVIESSDLAYFYNQHVRELLKYIEKEEDRLLLNIFIFQFSRYVEKRPEIGYYSLVDQAERTNNFEVIKRVAKICIVLKNFKAARKLLELAESVATQQKLKDERVEIYLLLGRVLSHLKDFQNSSTYFTKYLDNILHDSREYLCFQEFLGDDEFIKGNYRKSEEKYQNVLRFYIRENVPGNKLNIASLNLKLSQCFLMLKDYTNCTKHLKECLQLEKNNSNNFHPLLAEIYQTEGRYFLSQMDFNTSLSKLEKCRLLQERTLSKFHYDTSLTYFYIGDLYLKCSDLTKSENYLKECLSIMEQCTNSLEPEFEKPYLGLGIITFKSLSFKDSIKYCKQLIDINLSTVSNNKVMALAYFQLGTTYSALCDYYNASQYFEKCISSKSIIKKTTSILMLKSSAELLRCYYETDNFNDLNLHLNKISEYLRSSNTKEKDFFLLKVGELYLIKDELIEAEKIFYESLRIRQAKNDQLGIADINLKIGELEIKKRNFVNAQELLDYCYQVRYGEQLNLKLLEIVHKKGEVSFLMNDFSSAKGFLNYCLDIRQKILEKSSIDLIRIYIDFGSILAKEFIDSKNTKNPAGDQALHYLNRAFQDIPKMFTSHKQLIIKIYKLRGDIFYAKEENIQALFEYVEFLKLAENNSNSYFSELCLVYQRNSEIYEMENNITEFKVNLNKCLKLLMNDEPRYHKDIISIRQKLYHKEDDQSEKEVLLDQIEGISKRYNV